jgi:glycogen synthase
MGIRNGIDLDIWDPENDTLLPMPYSTSNVVEVRHRTFQHVCMKCHGHGDCSSMVCTATASNCNLPSQNIA